MLIRSICKLFDDGNVCVIGLRGCVFVLSLPFLLVWKAVKSL